MLLPTATLVSTVLACELWIERATHWCLHRQGEESSFVWDSPAHRGPVVGETSNQPTDQHKKLDESTASQIHKYKYTAPQIHKYKYTASHIHNHKYHKWRRPPNTKKTWFNHCSLLLQRKPRGNKIRGKKCPDLKAKQGKSTKLWNFKTNNLKAPLDVLNFSDAISMRCQKKYCTAHLVPTGSVQLE